MAEKKQEPLNRIREAIEELPEQYQESVYWSLIHDIGVMKQAIQLVQLTQQAG